MQFPEKDIKMWFICSDPYGPEFLFAYASTVPFAPLKTTKEVFGQDDQGHEIAATYILDDLATVKKQSIAKGFQTVNGSVVEKKLQLTTRERKL